MACILTNADQDGSLPLDLFCAVLQRSDKLVRVEGYDAIIVIPRYHEHGRHLHGSYVVQRRVFDQVIKAALLYRAVFTDPCCSDGKLVEAKHISNRNLGDDCAEILWILVRHSCHDHASVGATDDGCVRRISPPSILHELGSICGIIKTVLLLVKDAVLMPAFTKVSAASNTGDSKHTSHVLHPREKVFSEAMYLHGHAEATVNLYESCNRFGPILILQD